MIDLPTKAEVYCSNGIAGISTYVIANPVNSQVTHLVVKSARPPFREYIVPVEKVGETTPSRINLKCTLNELEKMDPFEVEEYIRSGRPSYLYYPYAFPVQSVEREVASYVLVKNRNVPHGEIAVWRGAKVEATDGYVGLVDELLINSNNMHATLLVLRERHIFQDREITIPVSQIDRVFEDTIYLKLDRQSVEKLPTTPIQRWQVQEH